MFTFAAKPRTLRLRSNASLALPDIVTLRAKFGPAWLFGAGEEGRRLVVKDSTGVRTYMNANTGRGYVTGGTPPARVAAESVLFDEHVLRLDGDSASVSFRAETVGDIVDLASALLFGLPLLLNVRLQFPCFVEHVIGSTSCGDFGFEANSFSLDVAITDEASQNGRATRALTDLAVFRDGTQRRLQAALVYFHRAARLLEAGHSSWEFMSEAVLNFAKILGSLFPPSGERGSIDAARAGLQAQGYSAEHIETWFVPALALRNNLDVAHVWLALLTEQQIEALGTYAANAAGHFRALMSRIVDSAARNELHLTPYTPSDGDARETAVISKITERLTQVGLLAPEA